jgi:RNA polymerase sigma factor (TIGR02999 family)
MSFQDPQTFTLLLREARDGQSGAVNAVLPLVHSELQGLARGLFANERSDHTLQPTALINEAWMKLAGHAGEVEDKRHFFALASRAMRQVLTDHARRVGRQKRGDGAKRITLDQPVTPHLGDDGLDLVDLEDSLERLAALNERHARMVELRVFGGLTIPEAAEALGVSHATVERDWFTVRAWLRRELCRPA